jgi:hypothetical protein
MRGGNLGGGTAVSVDLNGGAMGDGCVVGKMVCGDSRDGGDRVENGGR